MSDPKKQFDVEEALRLLAEAERLFDSTLTEEELRAVAVLRRTVETQGAERMYAAGADQDAAEHFDLLVTADAMEALANKIHAAVELKEAQVYQQALQVYYALEELVKDPANAHLQAEVERLRAAHLRDYGKPIPSKKEQ